MDQYERPGETVRLSPERLDTLLRALAAEPRRLTYIYLDEHESAAIEPLADAVVEWSRARSRTTDPPDRAHMPTALHHRHLPALDEAGIVSYDADEQTAALASLSPATTEVLSKILDLDAVGPSRED
ncbi:DUF7344 domain-containing protein [Haloarcula brevis]|uniref:DUF7344 domain-containing protein n=1 Tax=Haloarcula brevis TaxID=3111453 RepID=UPI00300F020E